MILLELMVVVAAPADTWRVTAEGLPGAGLLDLVLPTENRRQAR